VKLRGAAAEDGAGVWSAAGAGGQQPLQELLQQPGWAGQQWRGGCVCLGSGVQCMLQTGAGCGWDVLAGWVTVEG
jgi:hypothetical protein